MHGQVEIVLERIRRLARCWADNRARNCLALKPGLIIFARQVTDGVWDRRFELDNQEFELKADGINKNQNRVAEYPCLSETRFLDSSTHPPLDSAKPSDVIAEPPDGVQERQVAGADLPNAVGEPAGAATELRGAPAGEPEAHIGKSDEIIDLKKGTIFVVSHEASRSRRPF